MGCSDLDAHKQLDQNDHLSNIISIRSSNSHQNCIYACCTNKSYRKLPQIENNMKIEASISLRRRDEEVKVHGEPDCWNLG